MHPLHRGREIWLYATTGQDGRMARRDVHFNNPAPTAFSLVDG